MNFCGQPGSQVMYQREVNAVAKITLPTRNAETVATIALADIGLSAATWTYAEMFAGWEVTNLEAKTNYHSCAIVGTDLVITQGTDVFVTGDQYYIRLSRFPLTGNTPTLS